MGTFRVTIQVGDPAGQRYESLEALADTGATYSVVPASLLGRLGVTAHSRDRFVLADGREVDRDIGRTWIRVDGRAEVTLVVFGEADSPAVLGAYTLEGLRLAVDPVARRLVPVTGLLLPGPLRQLAAARSGEHGVGQEQVDGPAFGLQAAPGLLTVRGLQHKVALLPEHAGGQHAHGGLVLHEEHGLGASGQGRRLGPLG